MNLKPHLGFCFSSSHLVHPAHTRTHTRTQIHMYAKVDGAYIYSLLSNLAVFALLANRTTVLGFTAVRVNLCSYFTFFFKVLDIFRQLLIFFWWWIFFVKQHVVCVCVCVCGPRGVTGGGSSQTYLMRLSTYLPIYLLMDWSIYLIYVALLSLFPLLPASPPLSPQRYLLCLFFGKKKTLKKRRKKKRKCYHNKL